MNYLKSIISYYLKNFWFLTLLSVIPALFIGLLLRPFQFVEFLYQYPFQTLGGFSDFFFAILSFDWLSLLLGIVGLFLVATIMSILLGKMESHFRIGRQNYSLKDSGFNNNFSSVLLAVFCVAFCYLVLALLSAMLIMLFNFIFSGSLMFISVILSYIVALIFFWLMSVIVVHFGVLASDRMIMGSTFATAMSNASQATHKNTAQRLLVGLLPFLLSFLLTLLGSWLGIVWLTNIISLLIILPYFSIFVLILFFDHYGLTRYDTRPYYNLR